MSLDEKLIIKIIKSVAINLCYLNNELEPVKNNNYFSEKVIFPVKRQKKNIKRISEQELRLVFCQELYERNIHFSIETPTKYKYKLSKNYDCHSSSLDGENGQSASIDTTIFNYLKTENRFERKFNIEFKHKGGLLGISKDILKLFAEDENALFIQLLKNSNRGTFVNENEKCLFKKYVDSINAYKEFWNKKKNKFIIFSFIILDKKSLFYKKFIKKDLNSVESFFYKNLQKSDDAVLSTNGWKIVDL